MKVSVEPSTRSATDDAIYIFEASTVYQAALLGLHEYIDSLDYFDAFPTYFTVTNLKTKKKEKVSSELVISLMALENEKVVTTDTDIEKELQRELKIEQEWFNG